MVKGISVGKRETGFTLDKLPYTSRYGNILIPANKAVSLVLFDLSAAFLVANLEVTDEFQVFAKHPFESFYIVFPGNLTR